MIKAIAITPSNEIVQFVQVLKKLLYKQIGWYPSVNAAAHLTICTLEDDDAYSQIWLRKFERFCKTKEAFELKFNAVKCFPESGTVYIGLDETSHALANKFMADFHKTTGDLKARRTYQPHMSIARNLNPEQLQIAMRLLGHMGIDLGFECDQVCIRRLDDKVGQYEIESRHSFGGINKASIYNPQLLYLF